MPTNFLKYLSFLVSFLLWSPYVEASEHAFTFNYDFKEFNVADGLPSSQIYQIIQSRDEHIWFGTDRGLVRFDGKEFEVLTTENGLVGNTVFYVSESVTGDIWYYCSNRKVGFVRGNRCHEVPWNKQLQKIAANVVYPKGMYLTPQGGTLNFHYVPTGNIKQKTVHYDIRKGLFQSVQEPREMFTYSIDYTPSAYPSITSSENEQEIKSLYSDIHDVLIEVYMPNGDTLRDTSSIQYYDISRVYRTTYDTATNSLFFNIQDQIFQCDGNQIQKIATLGTNLLCLDFNSQFGLMAGTSSGLLMHLDGQRTEAPFFKDKMVSSIFEDGGKNLWVGTLFNGIHFLGHDRHQITSPTLKNQTFTHILEVGSQIFVGSSVGEVCALNGSDSARVIYKPEKKSFIRTLSRSYDDNVLLVYKNFQNLFVLDTNGVLDRDQFFNRINITKQMEKFEKSKLFGGADRTIIFLDSNSFDGNTQKTKEFPEYTQIIKEIEKDSFLVGAKEGAFLLNWKEGKLTPYRHNIPYFRASIRDLLIHPKRPEIRIYATHGEGVILEKGQHVFQISKLHGLSDNNTDQVLLAEDRIIASSKQGVSIISEEKIHTISRNNGILKGDVNDIFYRNDTLWVATSQGMNRMHISFDQTNEANIIMKNLVVGKTPVPFKNRIRLSPYENEFSVEPRALCFPLYGGITYQYRLLGMESVWHTTSNGTIRYSNLAPGKYQLQVAYLDDHSNWSSPKVMLHITKEKIWYTRIRYILLFTTSLMFLIYLIIHFYVKRIQKKAILQYQLIDLERKALQSQMNPHFIFNALTSIQSLIVQEKIEESADYLGSFAKLTRLALNHSTEKYVSLHDELSLIENYVVLEQLRFDGEFDFEIINHLTESGIKVPPTVIQPFVENAIIHGLVPKTGKGQLLIELKQVGHSRILCVVSDNGVGRDRPDSSVHKGKSMGVQLIRDRLKILLKTTEDPIQFTDLKDESGAPQGTLVEILIPRFE